MLACATSGDVLSFPGPPHLSERALRRFLFSVLSVSFSFVFVQSSRSSSLSCNRTILHDKAH